MSICGKDCPDTGDLGVDESEVDRTLVLAEPLAVLGRRIGVGGTAAAVDGVEGQGDTNMIPLLLLPRLGRAVFDVLVDGFGGTAIGDEEGSSGLGGGGGGGESVMTANGFSASSSSEYGGGGAFSSLLPGRIMLSEVKALWWNGSKCGHGQSLQD